MAALQSPKTSSRRSKGDGDGDTRDVILGKYTKIEEIGRGSFATVYQGIHNKYRSCVAIKAVNISSLNPKLKDNLKLEIEILKGLQHPHIVALIDCDESTSCIHLVMEYCALGDLSLFIRKRDTLSKHELTRDMIAKYPNPPAGGLNEVIVRHFLKQLASALQFLRTKDLIHRDLKPQNLLLNPPPSTYAKGLLRIVPYKTREDSFTPLVGVESLPMLKIADFGFARSLPATSLAETLCGSPLYMAPEILRYEKYDAKADLWSVGTVLFEMVVGKSPFRAGNHVDLLRKIEQGEDNIRFPIQTEASPPLKKLIRSLLKRNPVERLSFKDFFESSVVKGNIPGLVDEDLQAQRERDSRHAAHAARRDPLPSRTSDGKLEDRPASSASSPRPPPSNFTRPATSPAVHHVGSRENPDLQRVAVKARKASVASVTGSPSKEELRDHNAKGPVTEQPGPPSPAKERATSRKNSSDQRIDDILDSERERAAQDVAFERDYVVVEKRAVEVNAFADELAASPRFQQQHQQLITKQAGAIIRRATTTATPQLSSSPRDAMSRAVATAYNRPRTGSTHNRHNSYDRRYGPSPTSATSAISKALNKASGRLFGVSFSPPLALTKAGRSPPIGYNAFPAYPLAEGNLAVVGDGAKIQPPLDEDTKVLHIIEEIATRSDVVYGFAEVKYKQLAPLTPSMQADTAIKPVVSPEAVDTPEANDTGLTVDAIFTLSEEALVLYVKALSLLAKSMDIAGAWWARKNRGETIGNSPNVNVGCRVNNVVQWVRNRFNEVLQKAEYSRLKLLDAQRQLPYDHAHHASQVGRVSVGALAHSSDQVVISSGITAEKLMYDRALEMSRTAAINELTGEDLPGCEIAYMTAIRMLEAVLESDEDPQLSGERAGEAANTVSKEENGEVNGLQGEDREIVVKLVSSIRIRLTALKKKIALMTKRTSAPAMVSPARTPACQPPVASPVVPQPSSR
ncbi:Serine/threonine-protein kinase [Coccidioides posadasii str. Silveira]|uniref:Serine/threonine-protein kinase ATG1 n=2 Tax=Coccidioides posadasii TaxID=199306 RepID=E9DET6_COCPS|nr:Protein kinase domain containing protein [Coccidioides posadasii C735 delta SOWgp]EER22931.1 Protein kinase domain containing protein [Coccidioides posadasii C735 delta SOWgp]EFW15149.1 serine/threonine protein kinase [Coccidioides posadasii str. Silveira]QVM09850.1 Serine/threonine-protein kinase [Coccidioides posadasii str. Silveira]|eukprot:XP_003065076.1 Protein kinase domain containing protein [Coccidioides posadasii C735 delta SOWgp]